jgi:hypothetical protein
MNADPENRLVCTELERLWNEKMADLLKSETELRKHEKESESSKLITDMNIFLHFPERLNDAWINDDICITDKKLAIQQTFGNFGISGCGIVEVCSLNRLACCTSHHPHKGITAGFSVLLLVALDSCLIHM